MTPDQTLLGKCAAITREHGLLELARRAGRRLRETLGESNSADWYRVPLSPGQPLMAIPPMPPGVAIRFDDPEQAIAWMAALAPRFGYAFVPEEVQAAREHAHPLGLLTVEGCTAGYLKVAVNEAYVTDLRRRVRLPADTAFIYDTFIHPDYRGRGLAGLLVADAKELLSQRGYRWLGCHIPRWNVASRATFAGQGFEPVGFVRNIRLLRWTFSLPRPETLLGADSHTSSAAG